mgnify:CR=1 FL=1
MLVRSPWVTPWDVRLSSSSRIQRAARWVCLGVAAFLEVVVPTATNAQSQPSVESNLTVSTGASASSTSAVSTTGALSRAHIQWRSDLNRARWEAQSRGLPVWIQFTGPWCPSCRRMESETFVDPSVVLSSQSDFVTVQLRSDHHEDLAHAYGLSYLPATVVIHPSGEVINRHEGFADPQKFLGFLQGSLSRLNRTITRAQKPASTTQLAAASTQESRFGLQGYCPVTFVRTGKLISGQDQWSVVHEGIRYRFATAIGQEEFRKNPDRFAPALHGMCAVRRLDYDSQVEGLPTFAVYVNDRLYLCSDQESREKFSKNPIKYAIVESPRDQNTRIARTEIVTPPTSTPSPSPSPGSGTTARALR